MNIKRLLPVLLCLTLLPFACAGCGETQPSEISSATQTSLPSPSPETITPPPRPEQGTWESIPEDIQTVMRGVSMPEESQINYDDFAYLTIPHHDYQGRYQIGI